jgi:hypothetical protein
MRRAIRETLMSAVRDGFVAGMVPTLLLSNLHGQLPEGRRAR